MPAPILVVEDDAALRRTLHRVLTSAGFEVTTAADGPEAEAILARNAHDVVLLDLGLPGKSGLDLLRDHAPSASGTGLRPAFVILSGHDDGDITISAMKHGAYDFLLKPPDLARVVNVLQAAARAVHPPIADVARVAEGSNPLVGRSAAMREVFKEIGRIAHTRATVLVTGESGTGKELVARALHAAGPDPSAPFVAVNCAAISANLLPSELFGHAKGSFTGATGDRVGRFEEAAEGTLLLDEIGELDADLQAKLLRVLEQRTFERVGEGTPRRFEARVIAATNRDLAEAVEEGRFRLDLLHRLDVVGIHLPPLRERPEDIPLLVERLLDRVSTELGVDARASADALDWLQAQPWPGNVRQLYNTLQRAALRHRGVITAAGLADGSRDPGEPARGGGAAGDEDDADDPEAGARTLEDVERAHILATLRRTGWHKRRTAEALGISRVTLDRKIRRYDLDQDRDDG